MKFKLKSIAALLSVLFFGLQVFAGGLEEFKKEYHETFDVNKDVILTVSNKFGFVKIVTSETDQINIDVKVTVEAKNAEKAKKLLDEIQIEIIGNKENVSAITKLAKGSKFKELSIDYTITMPVSGNVDITNKFGSFYLNELNGNSKIYVGYGSLDVGSLNSQNNDVTVKFGSGKVKYAQYLNYVSRYSSVHIDRAKLLNLDTQYGDARVGEVGRMDLKNAYGDVRLGTIVELKADVALPGEARLTLALSYTDTRDRNIDKRLLLRPFKTGLLRVEKCFGETTEGFLSGVFLGSRRDSSVATGEQLLGSHLLLALGVKQRISENIGIEAGVTNLLNKKLYYSLGSPGNGLSSYLTLNMSL